VKRIAPLVLALMIVPSMASAASFTATLVGTGKGTSVSGTLNNNAFSVWAGEIKWHSTSDWLDDFISYCIQLDSPATTTEWFATQVPGHISSTEASQIAYLISTNFSKVTSDAVAAGLQLAIWNVLYDNGDFSLLTGAFRASTGAAFAAGNLFLLDLQLHQNAGGSALFLDSLGLRGLPGQDQVTTMPVPEPASLLLLGSGAALVAIRLRRKRPRPDSQARQ
jgi:hypothetical protein